MAGKTESDVVSKPKRSSEEFLAWYTQKSHEHLSRFGSPSQKTSPKNETNLRSKYLQNLKKNAGESEIKRKQ